MTTAASLIYWSAGHFASCGISEGFPFADMLVVWIIPAYILLKVFVFALVALSATAKPGNDYYGYKKESSHVAYLQQIYNTKYGKVKC